MGGLSDIYPFQPAMSLDLDFFIRVAERNSRVGAWLLSVTEWCDEVLRRWNGHCDVRVVRGPIKPVHERLTDIAITLHPAVFSADEYAKMSPFLRWGWRKYRCEVDTTWLARLAPADPPTPQALLTCRGGVLRTLLKLREGTVELREWCLPDFRETTLVALHGDTLFIEYCLSKAAGAARNHARCLGWLEPDYLTNDEFGPWYLSNIMGSNAFERLMIAKRTARLSGYGSIDTDVRWLAIEYFTELETAVAGPQAGQRRSAALAGHPAAEPPTPSRIGRDSGTG